MAVGGGKKRELRQPRLRRTIRHLRQVVVRPAARLAVRLVCAMLLGVQSAVAPSTAVPVAASPAAPLEAAMFPTTNASDILAAVGTEAVNSFAAAPAPA